MNLPILKYILYTNYLIWLSYLALFYCELKIEIVAVETDFLQDLNLYITENMAKSKDFVF